MHQASPDSSTARLPLSGTAAQNCLSRISRCDSARMPASLILSSWEPRIFRRFSISWFMRSSIWRTALTFTSPRSNRSSAKRIAKCSASFTITDSSGLLLGACPTASSPCSITGTAAGGSGISRSRCFSSCYWSARARSRNSAAFRTLGRGDQFEQLLGVVQPLSELLLVAAKRRGSNLSSYARVFQPRIGGHEANLVDADPLGVGESGFQLQGQLGWFGFAGGKGAHKSSDLFFGEGGEKLYEI